MELCRQWYQNPSFVARRSKSVGPRIRHDKDFEGRNRDWADKRDQKLLQKKIALQGDRHRQHTPKRLSLSQAEGVGRRLHDVHKATYEKVDLERNRLAQEYVQGHFKPAINKTHHTIRDEDAANRCVARSCVIVVAENP